MDDALFLILYNFSNKIIINIIVAYNLCFFYEEHLYTGKNIMQIKKYFLCTQWIYDFKLYFLED